MIWGGREFIEGRASLERNKYKISIRMQPRKRVRARSVPGIMGEAGLNVTLPSWRAQ